MFRNQCVGIGGIGHKSLPDDALGILTLHTF